MYQQKYDFVVFVALKPKIIHYFISCDVVIVRQDNNSKKNNRRIDNFILAHVCVGGGDNYPEVV